MDSTSINLARPAYLHWAIPGPGQSMCQWQAGRCAMCGSGGALLLDHDHDTGLTRGYLCQRCNHLEGVSSRACWITWRAGGNPATLLGEAEPYRWHGWRDGVNILDTLYPEPTEDDLRAAINLLP